jgi:hypothetical protein
LKSADALGQSPLQRKRYIAATNRAILSNALVAASSSATKLPMAPVAIFSTRSVHMQLVAKQIDFNHQIDGTEEICYQSDFSKASSFHKTPALGSEEDSPCSSMEAPKFLYLFKVAAVIPPLENHIILHVDRLCTQERTTLTQSFLFPSFPSSTNRSLARLRAWFGSNQHPK